MLDGRCHSENYCFQEFCNGEGRRRQRLSSISWEGKKVHKGLKRGFHFYHMPYCVNICISLLKVFRRWAGHQLLVSCSSRRHLLPQSINQSVQRDILLLLAGGMQTTAPWNTMVIKYAETTAVGIYYIFIILFSLFSYCYHLGNNQNPLYGIVTWRCKHKQTNWFNKFMV